MSLWPGELVIGGRGGDTFWVASEWIFLQCDYPGWSPARASKHEASDHPPAATREQAKPGCGGSRTRYKRLGGESLVEVVTVPETGTMPDLSPHRGQHTLS